MTESARPDDQAWAEVGRASYVSFTSYRKDGTPVSTPIWIAPDAGNLYFFSDTDAFKVKRVRNNPAVTLQPCDVRGRVKEGAPSSRALPRCLTMLTRHECAGSSTGSTASKAASEAC
jgi:uncharacterized protein